MKVGFLINYKTYHNKLVELTMSRSDLAKATGIAPSTIYHIAPGIRVKRKTLLKIAEVLGCPIADLVIPEYYAE